GTVAEDFVGDRFCSLRTDFTAAAWTKRFRDPRPKQFQIIIDLGHRADGGTRGFDRIGLLDRDRGRDPADVIDPRLIHAVEELAHVRTERFDVTALAFGVNGFKRERRFPRAARAGNNGQFSERKIDIYAL